MKRKVILIGRINQGHLPIGGETAKNQALVAELGKYCRVIALDFYRNKLRPWVYLQTLWALLRYPDATIILSTTARNIYPLLKVFKTLGLKRHIIHWIIGGEFDKLVKEGRFNLNVLNVAQWHLAQSKQMVENLRKCGLRGVRYVPNFRKIPKISHEHIQHSTDNSVRFVYMSRIMKEKGVGEILQCEEHLNSLCQDRYAIDFYGRLDESYQEEFYQTIEKLPNVEYNGVLNLNEISGYETLASYHAMLFPTFHPSEGIAGAIIDAYIAGIPVIASDWNHNREVVRDGETGIIVPVHNIEMLTQTMRDIIDGKIDLSLMAANAKKEAEKYRAENTINEDFLKELGIL